MQESYDKGVAIHVGPELCVARRKVGCEALVGARASSRRVSSDSALAEYRRATPRWRSRGAISSRPRCSRRRLALDCSHRESLAPTYARKAASLLASARIAHAPSGLARGLFLSVVHKLMPEAGCRDSGSDWPSLSATMKSRRPEDKRRGGPA